MATVEESIRSSRKSGKYPNTKLGKLSKFLRIPAKHVEMLYKRSVSKVLEPVVDYSDWTRDEMYDEAKKLGLDINSRTNKANLLKALKAK